MKRLITLCLVFILIFFTSCAIASFNTSDANDEPIVSQKKQVTIFTMNDLMVIKLAADYLKDKGEQVAFDETEMILHYEHENPVLLPVVHGEHIEYSDNYLEIIMYQNTDDDQTPCKACYTVYMSETGKIIGYNK